MILLGKVLCVQCLVCLGLGCLGVSARDRICFVTLKPPLCKQYVHKSLAKLSLATDFSFHSSSLHKQQQNKTLLSLIHWRRTWICHSQFRSNQSCLKSVAATADDNITQDNRIESVDLRQNDSFCGYLSHCHLPDVPLAPEARLLSPRN